MAFDIRVWTTEWFGSGPNLSPLQMALRAVAIFLLTLILIRISGRRSFGQRSAFDACVTVLLGAVMSRAVVGASPFWGVVAASAAIVAIHRLLGWANTAHPWLEKLLNGSERTLVRDGVIDATSMRKALVTRRDLEEGLRKHAGHQTLASIAHATLERNGEITITLKHTARRGQVNGNAR